MTISDFFDPHKSEHILAYAELQRTGTWPRSFWEEAKAAGVEFDPSWAFSLASKLADCWVEHKLTKATPPRQSRARMCK